MQAKHSTEAPANIATLIEQLRTSVSMSCEDLIDLASHDREAMEESKQEVVRTHADFRAFLDRSEGFLREAATDSHRVTSEIHASVRGLQFQDRASQRLEFIATELDRVGAAMATEFHVTARNGHEAIGAMMTRTSMREQREPAACVSAGEVELF